MVITLLFSFLLALTLVVLELPATYANSEHTIHPVKGSLITPNQRSPQGFIFSPYKDTSINMDWNTYKISTKVEGTQEPLTEVLTKVGNSAVTLAFATGDCAAPNWGGVPNATLAEKNVPFFQKNNINYVISTGGAAGIFSCSSVADMENFLQPFVSKNFMSLDFDIEASTDFTALMNTTAAVQKQWAKQGKTLHVSLTLATLAVKGSTLNQLGQSAIQAAKNAGLIFNVNLMVMDYGSTTNCQLNSESKCDMSASAILAANEVSRMYSIPLNRIELTPMIGENDSPDETTTLNDITKITQFVKQNGLAGIHFWSFDRDTPCAQGGFLSPLQASPTCNHVSKSPLKYDKAVLLMTRGSRGI